MDPEAAVVASHLVREFRQRPGRDASLRRRLFGPSSIIRAVDNVDLVVTRGEMIGFLGVNGAGKSTTVKLLSGLLLPTTGTVRLHGLDPWKDRHRCSYILGVVFGQRSQLVYDTPLISSFRLIRDLYALDAKSYARRLDELVSLLGAEDFLDRPVRSLSLGQRMRGDLIAALLPTPRILFLDEPTIGLDILAKEAIYTFLEHERGTGNTTIILTSHDMRDIERLCKRVVIIDQGRSVYDGTVSQLKTEVGSDATVSAELDAPSDALVNSLMSSLRSTPGVGSVSSTRAGQRTVVSVTFDQSIADPSSIVAQLVMAGPLSDLVVTGTNLDDVIHRLYHQLASRSSSATPRPRIRP